MRDLILLGAGGHGRETLDLIEAVNAVNPVWKVLGFLDDARGGDERLDRRGVAVLGSIDDLPAYPDADVVLAIGGGPARRAVHDRIAERVSAAITLVHPTAVLGGDNRLNAGVIIAAGCHVTTNVTIGFHTHLNIGTSVHHDVRIGSLVTLSPGVVINGDVSIGDDVWVGPGAVIARGVSVGRGAVVGAGAVVLGDVVPGARVAGVPARPLETSISHALEGL